MKTKNEVLYDKALEAIRELYEDTSVSQADAISILESLVEETELLIDTLESAE
jgi:uncharacterized protein (UPF0147 family)